MPNATDVHVDRPLTNLLVGRLPKRFIGSVLLPDLPVKHKSDEYYIFDSGNRGRSQSDDLRSDLSETNRVDFDYTTGTYATEGHALKTVIPREVIANAERPLRPFVDGMDYVVARQLINQEIDAKAVLDAVLTGGQTSDPTNEWDDTANGDPFSDINLAVETIEDATGLAPNVMGMDSKVWHALRDHPDIVDRVKYMGTSDDPGQITTKGVAALFGLDEVAVTPESKNTAVKGQSASLSRIWGSDVYVAHVAADPSIMTRSMGYRFVWSGLAGANRDGYAVDRWYDKNVKGYHVEVERYYVHEVTSAVSGYRLQNRLT